MVWALIPIDSLRGAQKYYIFSKGTFHVGRKDCDIIIQTDTSISRNHAEIVVESMSTSGSSPVHLIDKSKYGTFKRKESGSNCQLVKNKGEVIDNGDFITFGTSNATFRFCHIPIIFYAHGSRKLQKDVQAWTSSIGAQACSNWGDECTHVLVGESCAMTMDLMEAVIAKKPVTLADWLKVLVEKNIRTEFPSSISHTPTVTFESKLIKIVDPTVRDKCLDAFTFVLGLSWKYKYKEKIQPLIEAVGAKFISAKDFCSDNQDSADDVNNYLLIVPEEYPFELDVSCELSALPKITDVDLIASICCGHLDTAIIKQPAITVSSSHSTDETIVADSETEEDVVTSSIAAPLKLSDDKEDAKPTEYVQDTTKPQASMKSTDAISTSVENIKTSYPNDSIKKIDKSDEALADSHENSDILYSENLIVRDFKITTPVLANSHNVVNFKRFKKGGNTTSGNRFGAIIPFSKDPYKESDYGNNEMEYMREEKKRKQMEAMAEDLFNNQKAKKQATGGASLHSFLKRR